MGHLIRMRDRLPPCLARLAFLGLLVLALATGMTARPVPTAMDQQWDAWAMAGLSSDALCGDHGDDRHGDGHCPLCTLTGAAHPPSRGMFARSVERRLLARRVLPQVRRAVGRARDPALPKRGPPILT